MKYDLTDDQSLLQATTRRFLEKECSLGAVRNLWTTADGYDGDYWKQAAALGWTCAFIPEEFGGGSVSGRPVEDTVVIAEEMGRLVAPGPFLPSNVFAAALAAAGTAEQRQAHLPGLVTGERAASWALQETGGAWEGPRCSIATSAAVEGTDIVVSGTKAYVEAAATADTFLVAARTGNGLTLVLVPATAAGVTVRGGRSIDVTRRFGTLSMDAVRLPLTAVLGAVGGAEDAVERSLQLGLVLQAAETIGAAAEAFRITVEYMSDRFAFGRPISSFQALKHRVADMRQWVEFAHGIVDAAAAAVQDQSAEASMLVSVAKTYVADRALDIVDDCVQLSGGIGVTWEHDIHLFSRRVALNRALLGTPEQHKERICILLERRGEVGG